MPVSIKKKLSIKKFLPGIKKRLPKAIKQQLADDIIREISEGRSPVHGKTFKKYSKSYSKIKGRSRPVDMIQSGKMLESIVITEKKPGTLRIFFKSKLAFIHNNKGAGTKKVIRRLLPDRRGEKFKPKIFKRVVNKIKKLVKSQAKKQK